VRAQKLEWKIYPLGFERSHKDQITVPVTCRGIGPRESNVQSTLLLLFIKIQLA